MHKSRLEAFSDGVIAIILTIMVLEMKVPHHAGADFEALRPVVPIFFSYIMSFIYVAIYWNNHHHLLQTAKHVNGTILWANMHLLFWLSLIPFVTAWMGETHFAALPVALYGVILFGAAVAYFVLAHILIVAHGKDSTLAKALGADVKGKISILLYFSAIILAFVQPLVSCAIYVILAIMWFAPDTRIEKVLKD
jgi:uncharacterized membrane protein